MTAKATWRDRLAKVELRLAKAGLRLAKTGMPSKLLGEPPKLRKAAPTVDELTAQLSALHAQYKETLSFALKQRRQAFWFRRLAVELARPARGWRRWLPYWMWRRRVVERLNHLTIFDARRYLNRNPDVGASRADPLYHFLRHGMAESRDSGVSFTTPAISPLPPVLRSAMLTSGLFDEKWYAETYRVTGDTEKLLEDYLATSVQDPMRNPGPLFSGSFYILENPDVDTHPLVHYIEHGMQQGRRAFRASAADDFMLGAENRTPGRIEDYFSPEQKVVVLHWAQGNFFFTDIARYVTQILIKKGIDATISTNHADFDLEQAGVVVVAPHEYCVHGPGADLPQSVLASIVHVNTEQWHTSWFSLALEKMLISRRAVDINPLSARGLARLGIDAVFLPLLPSAGTVFDFPRSELSEQTARLRAVKPLTFPSRFSERPYDIVFAGALNERRARELALLAPTLSRYDCFLHAPRLRGPVTADNPNMIGSSDIAQISRNAKLLLNIHQGDSHYFEWHRLLLSGIAHGCVPITEICADIGVVTAGKHYIAVSTAEMPEKIAWLLDTPAGARELELVHERGRALMASLERTYGQ